MHFLVWYYSICRGYPIVISLVCTPFIFSFLYSLLMNDSFFCWFSVRGLIHRELFLGFYSCVREKSDRQDKRMMMLFLVGGCMVANVMLFLVGRWMVLNVMMFLVGRWMVVNEMLFAGFRSMICFAVSCLGQ